MTEKSSPFSGAWSRLQGQESCHGRWEEIPHTWKLLYQVSRLDGCVDRHLPDFGVIVTYGVYGLVACLSESEDT